MKTHELTIVLFGSKVGGGGEKAVQKGLMELFEGQVVDTVHRPVHVMSHSLKQKFKGLEPFCCPAAQKKKESPAKGCFSLSHLLLCPHFIEFFEIFC